VSDHDFHLHHPAARLLEGHYVVGTTIFVDGGMTLYPNFV
jgi:hypothetical protein